MYGGVLQIDVLICCGQADVGYLFPLSLQCCLKNFRLLGKVTIVTPAKLEVIEIVNGLSSSLRRRVQVFHDNEVLPPHLWDLPGWFKQQILKLNADLICESPFVACLGADTLMLSPVDRDALFDGELPFLFYNRYPYRSNHLIYERQRVENVARLLRVEPRRSLPLGDFVMDFTIFAANTLRGLRRYIEELYGPGGIAAVLPRSCDTLEQKVIFGEWALHAVYLLDVLNEYVPLRNSQNQFVAQVHSTRDYSNYQYDSRIVHFVSKSFDVKDIRYHINRIGAI
jgi:hypothetical protein